MKLWQIATVTLAIALSGCTSAKELRDAKRENVHLKSKCRNLEFEQKQLKTILKGYRQQHLRSLQPDFLESRAWHMPKSGTKRQRNILY
jgi:hypothetical protein